MTTKLGRLSKLATFLTLILTAAAVQAQVRPYRVTDRQVQTIIDKLETDTDAFTTEMNRSLGRNNTSAVQMMRDFEDATDRLKNNFTDRRSSTADVQEVLNRASAITDHIRDNRVSRRSDELWLTVRSDIDTLAGYYGLTPNWTGTTPSGGGTVYTASARQMRNLLSQLRQRTLSFRQSYDSWNNQFDRPNNPRAGYDISQDVSSFVSAVDDLNRNYSRGASVYDVLRAASPVDRFIADNRANATVRSRWNLVRSDLDTLAGYYSVRWDWNSDNNAGTGGGWGGGGFGSLDTRLTGTYRLNRGQSDTITAIINRSVNANYETSQRDRVRRVLERRLTPPEMLAFDMRGRQITMAGPNGQTVTFDVDGQPQTETNQRGRSITTTVSATNNELTINYEGDRMNDYFVSFAPQRNGQLRVTRRIYLENQNQTVTATSVYDKTSRTADWSAVGSAGNNNFPGGQNNNAFIIPNNTQLIARLNTPLSTRSARVSSQFTMTVTSPSRYEGAVIEGTVSSGERSGVLTGRANMTLNFETIRLRGDNRTYNFAGLVEQVRDTDGDVLNVNNEGVVRDNNQTQKTVTRAGIGAVLGGIIGAIAGGGSGAAIGAAVGASAGAGSVVLQGRDNLDLNAGAEFTITATAPSYVGQPLR
jgi:hypothetical protein